MREKADRIVPHILYVADQRHPWQLAPIERLAVNYHTPTTVFVAFGTADASVQPITGRSGVSKQNYHVWCLLDDAAWERVQTEHAAFQATLDALADGLRQLGRYAERLAEAGGVARAPNPLTPTVIAAPDPDVAPSNWFTTRPVPRVERRVVVSHTPRMLRCLSNYDQHIETPHNQRDHFVCPTDADWSAFRCCTGPRWTPSSTGKRYCVSWAPTGMR